MNDTSIDLLEQGPRLRRLVISLFAGVLVGAIVATVCWRFMEPTKQVTYGAWKAMFFFTALGAAGAFKAVGWGLKRRADRRFFEPPKAVVRRSGG